MAVKASAARSTGKWCQGITPGGKQKNTERSSARAGSQSLYGGATLQSLPGPSGLCAWGSSAAMHKAHKSDAASYTASGGSDAAPSHEHAPHIIAKHIMPGPTAPARNRRCRVPAQVTVRRNAHNCPVLVTCLTGLQLVCACDLSYMLTALRCS